MGLKLNHEEARRVANSLFQTDPRGVEAIPPRSRIAIASKFQTDPRGVEAASLLIPVRMLTMVSDGPSWG